MARRIECSRTALVEGADGDQPPIGIKQIDRGADDGQLPEVANGLPAVMMTLARIGACLRLCVVARPERPLDPQSGPLAAFASDLRALRAQAGTPKYLQMARRTGRSRTALAEAAGGDHLPTWETVEAFVTACEGDPGQWLARWEQLRDGLAQTRRPAYPEPAASPQPSSSSWLAVTAENQAIPETDPGAPAPVERPGARVLRPRRRTVITAVGCCLSFAAGATFHSLTSANGAPGASLTEPAYGDRHLASGPVLVATSRFMRYGQTAIAASAGNRNGDVQVWNANANTLRTVQVATSALTGLAFDPIHQDTLISTSSDGHMRFFSSVTEQSPFNVALPSAGQPPVIALDPSSTGTVAVATHGGQVRIYDSVHYDLLRAFRTHVGRITSLQFEPQFQGTLAVGGTGGVEIWDASMATRKRRLSISGQTVTALQFDPLTPNTLVICDRSGRNQIWDTSIGGAFVRRLDTTAVITGLVFNPQLKNSLLAGTRTGTVYVIDPSSGTTVHTLLHRPWPITSIAITADAGLAVIGGDTGWASVQVPQR